MQTNTPCIWWWWLFNDARWRWLFALSALTVQLAFCIYLAATLFYLQQNGAHPSSNRSLTSYAIPILLLGKCFVLVDYLLYFGGCKFRFARLWNECEAEYVAARDAEAEQAKVKRETPSALKLVNSLSSGKSAMPGITKIELKEMRTETNKMAAVLFMVPVKLIEMIRGKSGGHE